MPRRGLRAFVAALPLLLATPALSAHAQTPAQVPATTTLTGTYELLAVDHETGDGGLDHHYREVLRIPGKAAVPVSLPAGHGLRAGSRITVSAQPTSTGTYDVRTVRRLAPASTLGSPGVVSVLVILAYWTAPDAVTPSRARAQFFTDDDAWFREASYGKAGLAGTVTPWLKIPKPANGQCLAGAETMMAYAQDKARTLGYDWTAFHRTVLYFPRCTGSDTRGVAGWAYEPGTSSWLNGTMDRRTTVHEQGHNYGMGHARSYACKSAAGTRTTFSRSCVGSEYGDPYDAMGRTSYVAHFTGYRKHQAGWLGTTRLRVLTSSSATTFTLPPLERAATVPNVVVANSPTTAGRSYWLEYRRPIGMDARLPSGATGGVMIHLRETGRFGLLDPTPRDASMTTAVLKPGTSWLSPDYVRFTVGTVSSTGARVTVTGAKPGPRPPSAPLDVQAVARDARADVGWAAPSSTGGATISGYRVSASAPGQVTVTRNLLGTTRQTTLTGLTNGVRYTVYVTAKNSAGYGPAATVTVTPRSEAPTVWFVSPAAGSALRNEVTVQVGAAPNAVSSSPVNRVDLSIGTTVWTSWNWNPTTFTVPTAGFPNGSHTLVATAYDERGRVGRTSMVVTFANLVPKVALTSPVSGTSYADVETLALAATASVSGDPSVTVSRVTFYDVTGYEPQQSWYGNYLGSDAEAPYEVPWRVSYIHGTRTIEARAVSSEGVVGRARGTVTIGHPKPLITLTSPVPGGTVSGATIPLRANVSLAAAASSVSSVSFFVDSVWIGNDTTAPYEVPWDARSRSGTAWIDVVVDETSGRQTRLGVKRFTVANVLPALTMTSPTGAQPFATPVTYSGVALPGGSGGEAPDKVVLTASSSGVTYGTATVAADGSWSLTVDHGTRIGAFDVYATASTPSGFLSPHALRSVVIEGPPVTTTFVSPGDGEVVRKGTTVDVRVAVARDASDPRYTYRVCAMAGSTYLGCRYYYDTNADGTFSLPWSVSQAPGAVTITATVLASDNGSTTVSRTVTVADALPPNLPSSG